MYNGFTAQEVKYQASGVCRLLLLPLLLLTALSAWAADGVLVVGDNSRSYFHSFYSALASTLRQNGVETTTIASLHDDNALLTKGSFRCIVTVGNEAAREVATKALAIPQLHALVTESFSSGLALQVNGQAPRNYLLIDQPISRLVQLAKSSMPGRKRLGVIYGPYSKSKQAQLRRIAADAGLLLVEKEIGESSQLSNVMASLSGSTDMLLTLPDSIVVNEGTAKTLILGAYTENLPLVGYSQALVKAGALMSVHSTPEQLGVQAGELINDAFWKDAAHNGQRIYPRYYQVSVNYQVANALQISLPSERDLKLRLEQRESQ